MKSMAEKQGGNTTNLPRLTPKGLAQLTMIENGVDVKTALLLTNTYKDTVSPQAVSKARAKFKKYSLAAPSTIKSANSQIKRILSGETREITQQRATKDGKVVEFTEVIAPSDTNILAAASMVYDRYEPVVKQTLNVNVECDPVNLEAFRNTNCNSSAKQGIELDSQVVDITSNDDRV